MSNELTIWLVEDDPAQTELVGLLLRNINPLIRYHSTSSAEELLATLANRVDREANPESIDLIITDLRMPKTNGIELVKKIKEISHFRTIPLIVLSASDLPSDIQQSYAAGANAYLVKPTGLDEFEHLLQQVVRFWSLVKT